MQGRNITTEAGRAARPAFIEVWDPFVRLFHWLLVASYAIAWITADEWDRMHEIAGYAIAVLVGLRILWGLVGTRHARFADFVYRPSAVLAYVKDSLRLRAKRHIGHNPAGGAMVLALLLALAITAATGAMTTMTAFQAMEWIEDVHEGAANLTLMLVFVHIAGVLMASLLHGENLIRSMVTGLKRGNA